MRDRVYGYVICMAMGFGEMNDLCRYVKFNCCIPRRFIGLARRLCRQEESLSISQGIYEDTNPQCYKTVVGFVGCCVYPC